MSARVLPAGRSAVLLEFGSGAEVAGWHAAVPRALAAAGLPAPVELVPGARTLLVDGVDPERARAVLAGLDVDPTPATARGPLVEVPTRYDGADLGAVAAAWGVSERDVVARHTGTVFEVAFCGFAPGFAYLTGLDVDVARRASPRPRVPAGSVALAGPYCGVYPTASPGGWQLIGRTAARLFDVDRRPPALLPPGTRVRFVPVDHLPDPGPDPTPPAPPAPTARGDGPAGRRLHVEQAAGGATVQDAGRVGHAHLGVPRAGALDAPAAALANRLVGNPPGAAVVEVTAAAFAVRVTAALTVAVTGAAGPLHVDGREVDRGVPLPLRAGQRVTVGAATAGVRAYLAVAGGVDVAPVLGSRSRDELAGLGPAPVRAGDVLPVGPHPGPPPALDFPLPAVGPADVVLRVGPGPRRDWFGDGGVDALLATGWTVSPAGNRVGVRLEGPPLPRRRTGELASEGMVLGAVQVPPDGQPVVLLADHPTTGGYPVVGVVDAADLAALAQARPGARVRFENGGTA